MTNSFKMSKISVAGVRQNVQELLVYSNETKKRNFLETVELQVGLKNYDPQRDKRFSGTIKLPSIPRPDMAICILGDQHDIDRAKHGGVDAMSVDDLKKLNRNKKLIKKLAHKYDAFVASESLIRQVPRLLGSGLSRLGKFPAPVSHSDDLSGKINEVKATIKFQAGCFVVSIICRTIGSPIWSCTARTIRAVKPLTWRKTSSHT